MNLQAQKKALLNEQARLRKDIEVTAPIVNSDHPGYSTHMADDASDVFEQEQNAMVHGQLQWLLSEVEHALEKIEDGTFGRCEACGKTWEIEADEAHRLTEALSRDRRFRVNLSHLSIVGRCAECSSG